MVQMGRKLDELRACPAPATRSSRIRSLLRTSGCRHNVVAQQLIERVGSLLGEEEAGALLFRGRGRPGMFWTGGGRAWGKKGGAPFCPAGGFPPGIVFGSHSAHLVGKYTSSV